LSLTAEQLAYRRQGVGSSEIAIVAGVSPFRKRPVDLYLEKRGLVEPEPSTEEMDAGNWLEPVIRDRYARDTGRRVVLADAYWPGSVGGTVRHPEHAWAMATCDGAVVEPGWTAEAGGPLLGLVECKNVGGIVAAREWDDETRAVPVHYLCQVQWQMVVTGAPWCDLAALLGGQRFRVRRVAHDPELAALLLEAARRFWERVRDEDPPIECDQDALRYLDARYPRETKPVVPAGTDAARHAQTLARAKRAARRVQAVSDRAEAALKTLLGEHAGLDGGWWRARWIAARGAPRWKDVALARGATEADAEAHRGRGSRKFTLEFEDDDEKDGKR
jgi:putative phage-type endonuclease